MIYRLRMNVLVFFLAFGLGFCWVGSLAALEASKNAWKCKATHFAGFSQSPKNEVTNEASDVKKGHIHIFQGIGSDILSMTWKGDKKGAAPDKFVRIPLSANSLVYMRGGADTVVLWQFLLKEKVAIKLLSYELSGSVNSSIQRYKCEQ